jgi:hypothetical protein
LIGKLIPWALILFLSSRAQAGLTDFIDMGDKQTIAGDIVGAHDLRRPARVIAQGTEVSSRLRVERNKPITIELEELDARERHVRAYLILINDEKIALRTWRGCGAGPVHFFITAPPRDAETITLRIVGVSRLPTRIARIWAFADFERYFDASGMPVPYRIAPTLKLSNSFDADLAKLRQVKNSLGQHPNVKPAWTTWVPYAKLSDSRITQRIDNILHLAEVAKMPVQICFDTWWGSTPAGPDGRGGYWTDVQYQQVVYDATTRRMQLSIPNRWASVPWLTVNHPDLNAFKITRLKFALSELRLRLRRTDRANVLCINLDNEPVYWASGNAGLGAQELLADFNPRAIAAAKKDDIILDPTNGLDLSERHWLSNNLLRYNQLIATAAAEALGRDPTDTADPLSNNIYTQAMTAHPALQYPMLDEAFPLWETAAPLRARVGGEWNGDSLAEQQAILHQLPLGRCAAVNAECGDDVRNMQGVRIGYALGQRYFTPYNYPLDKMDAATANLHDLTQSLPDFVHEPTLLEHDFGGDAWKGILIAHDGIDIHKLGNKPALAAIPATRDKPGHLLYRLKPPSDKFESLAVELSGRAFDFAKENDAVAIVVTVDGEEAGRITRASDVNAVHRIDLTPFARGRDAIDVRISLDPAGVAMREWCSLWQVRFTTAWPAAVTGDLPPQDRSLSTLRRQNLLVSWRRDAELAIADHDVPAARDAYLRGEYALAYRLANEAAPATFPATSAIAPAPAPPDPLPDERVTGVICQLRQLTPYEMPAIMLDVDNRLRIIHLAAPLHLRDSTVTFRTTPLGEVPLKAGDRVTLRCLSDSGRVMELWTD